MSEEMENLLRHVKRYWKCHIRECDLRTELEEILASLREERNVISPHIDLILKPFSYFQPECTKVIIIGQDPIRSNATGLSFSKDCLDNVIEPYVDFDGYARRRPGHSIWLIHEALKVAGILEHDRIYPCDHEEWASRGILLINAALTIGSNSGGHVGLWKSFMEKLLNKALWDIIIGNDSDNTWDEDYWSVEDDFNCNGHNVFVMLFGKDAHNLWRNVFGSLNYRFDGTLCFNEMYAPHPANRDIDEEYFIKYVADYMRDIDKCYPRIFSI